MSDSSPKTATLVGAVVGVLALLAGCSSTSSSTTTASRPEPGPADRPATRAPTSSAIPAPTPPPPPPDSGTCRDLTFSDINRYSNQTGTTPCERPHTAYTFAVTTLPDDIAFEGVEVKNDAVQQAAADSCRREFTAYVDGDAATRALVRLTATYFLPQQGSFDRGAHWVRCDVIGLQAEKILAELPSKLAGALDDTGIVADYSLCSVSEPGTPESVMVTCNQAHAYRAIAALRLGGTNTPYPGEAVTKDAGQQRCEALVKAEGDAGRGYTYSWTYPTAADWETGQRFGYCWNKTSA